MARETKVGLLAGLAFIVVFAAILANRGQRDPLLSQPSLSNKEPVVLGEQLVPHNPYETHEDLEGLSAHRYRSAPQQDERFGHEAVIQHPTREGNVPPDGTRFVPFRALSKPTKERIVLGRRRGRMYEERSTSAGSRNDPAPFASETPEKLPRRTAGQSSGENAIGLRNDIERRVGARVATPEIVIESQDGMRVERALSTKKKPAASGSRYVVLAGDTLYAIAGAHYGRRSGKLVRAIVEANRETLPDPNRLRVGSVLILPDLKFESKERTNAKSSTPSLARSSSAGSPTPVVATRSTDFEWYQVRKGDRYASIAREKLGDAGRWRELFELNKEKFPDPDRIRDGVLIKIPKPHDGGRS